MREIWKLEIFVSIALLGWWKRMRSMGEGDAFSVLLRGNSLFGLSHYKGKLELKLVKSSHVCRGSFLTFKVSRG